jgi:hypothetical protein
MTPGRITTILALLLGTGVLTGCDKLSGVAEQKNADAVAIGYACRVSEKNPEDCMKENESYSPDSILEGWKDANDSLKSKGIDFGATKSTPSGTVGGEKPAEGKPTEKPVEPKDAKPAGEQKPADAKGTPR